MALLVVFVSVSSEVSPESISGAGLWIDFDLGPKIFVQIQILIFFSSLINFNPMEVIHIFRQFPRKLGSGWSMDGWNWMDE